MQEMDEEMSLFLWKTPKESFKRKHFWFTEAAFSCVIIADAISQQHRLVFTICNWLNSACCPIDVGSEILLWLPQQIEAVDPSWSFLLIPFRIFFFLVPHPIEAQNHEDLMDMAYFRVCVMITALWCFNTLEMIIQGYHLSKGTSEMKSAAGLYILNLIRIENNNE